jgi:hypothetical protein
MHYGHYVRNISQYTGAEEHIAQVKDTLWKSKRNLLGIFKHLNVNTQVLLFFAVTYK